MKGALSRTRTQPGRPGRVRHLQGVDRGERTVSRVSRRSGRGDYQVMGVVGEVLLQDVLGWRGMEEDLYGVRLPRWEGGEG